MKHVIVIDTFDPPEGKPLSVAFQCDLIQKIEKLIQDEVGADLFYTQDRFNVDSAIEATHEMYNAPKWTAGKTWQQLVSAAEGILPRLDCSNPIRRNLPNPMGYASNTELVPCGECQSCLLHKALAAAKETW